MDWDAMSTASGLGEGFRGLPAKGGACGLFSDLHFGSPACRVHGGLGDPGFMAGVAGLELPVLGSRIARAYSAPLPSRP